MAYLLFYQFLMSPTCVVGYVQDDLNLFNKLYYGDNLLIMRELIDDESVELVYGP